MTTRSRFSILAFTCLLLLAGSGCSLFVMAGKAFFGDPKIPSEFRTSTGTDLTKSGDAVVIICTVPYRITSEHSSLQIDLLDRISRTLETQGVNIVPSGDVASWFDDHGEWGDYSELATEFDARYIIHINLREFTHRVPQSDNLLQGKAEGQITVHEHRGDTSDTKKGVAAISPVLQTFDRSFRLMFPGAYPVPRESRSEGQFIEGFTNRVALTIAQHFYDARMSDTIH